METGHPSTRAVNSGSGNRALPRDPVLSLLWDAPGQSWLYQMCILVYLLLYCSELPFTCCYSALMTQLSRGFFEQQYQSALVQLSRDSCADKERTKDELNEELNRELQRQMKVLLLYLFICLAVYLCMYLFIYISIYLACVSVCLSLCLSITFLPL